jgi:hypothetical protein
MGVTGATLIGSVLCFVERSALSATIVFLVGMIGVARPEIAVKPYNLWNRISGRLEQFIRFALLAICYYVVLLPVSFCGSRLVKRSLRENLSLWVPRGTFPPSGYSSQYTSSAVFFPVADGSVSSYLRWAMSTKNSWAMFLMPFLFLIRLVEPEHEESLPANLYTLF